MLIDFRQLFPKYKIIPKGVLHIGANVGEEAPVYDKLGISSVHWIEPNPELIPKLLHNVMRYNHCVYQIAAGDENKEITLHISNNAGQSSSVLELGTHRIAHPDVHYTHDVTVKMVRLDEYFADGLTADFLNLDVQGFEGNVLRGMGALLNQFKWVYTEVNIREVYKNCTLLPDLDLFMTANRFRRVETFGEFTFLKRLGWSDCLYTR